MANPLDNSSGLWTVLGQASYVVQLVGVDALGLVSMVVQAALAARRHRDACRRLAQHVELVGGLLRELELAELMRREATRRPLEQLSAALRRCYALATACQDRGGYLRRLFWGTWMADELRAAEQEIDMFVRLVPLIALVDTTHERRQVKATATEGVPVVAASCSNLQTRTRTRVEEFTEISVRGAIIACKVEERLLEGKMHLQEQKIMGVEELVKLCTRTEERYPGFKKYDFFQIVDGTQMFSEKRIVGSGGFGTVYKGDLSDGTVVAIKRFEHGTGFNSELQLLCLHHINIIKLLGWCVHGQERILVYEFLHNSSLDRIIFGMAVVD